MEKKHRSIGVSGHDIDRPFVPDTVAMLEIPSCPQHVPNSQVTRNATPRVPIVTTVVIVTAIRASTCFDV